MEHKTKSTVGLAVMVIGILIIAACLSLAIWHSASDLYLKAAIGSIFGLVCVVYGYRQFHHYK